MINMSRRLIIHIIQYVNWTTRINLSTKIVSLSVKHLAYVRGAVTELTDLLSTLRACHKWIPLFYYTRRTYRCMTFLTKINVCQMIFETRFTHKTKQSCEAWHGDGSHFTKSKRNKFYNFVFPNHWKRASYGVISRSLVPSTIPPISHSQL